MSIFDCTLFPFMLEAGQEQYELPGLMALAAPKRAERLRAQDILIIYARLLPSAGQALPLTHAQQKEALARLADTYFRSAGSVTAGLRLTAGRMNDFLFNRNVKSGNAGGISGSMTLAVVHSTMLYVAHTGPTHSYLVKKDTVQHFDDSGARGLGLSKVALTRFYQATLDGGDVLALCPAPPPGWEKSLAGLAQLNFDHIRRRFISDSDVSLEAATARFTTGKGTISFWHPSERSIAASRKPRPAQAEVSAQATAAVPADQGKLPEPVVEIPAVQVMVSPEQPPAGPAEPISDVEQAAPAEPVAPATESGKAVFLGESSGAGSRQPAMSARPRIENRGEQSPAAPHARQARPGESGSGSRPGAAAARVETAPPPARSKPKPPRSGPGLGEKLRCWLAPIWNSTRGGLGQASKAVGRAAARVLPKRAATLKAPTEPLINLSPSMMLAIAIIAPLLVVAVATTIYLRTGYKEKYTELFSQAQNYAAQAAQQQAPALLKQTWATVYDLVVEAEKYGETQESIAMRSQALAVLDDLSGITRLSFEPALTSPYPDGVNITRMLATLNQVYMLDGAEGRILSMTRITTGGYEPNYSFTCEPGKTNEVIVDATTEQAKEVIVGPLIDLAEIPINNAKEAEIVGIDAGANLMYCASGKTERDVITLQTPDMGWGKITAITIADNTLYVLDPMMNAVYRYDGDKGIFNQPPHLYFDDDIPHLTDVIDIAIDQEYMYLLHASGQMTICTSGGLTYGTTRCTDPSPYGDSRTGYEPAPLSFSGTNFTHVQTTQPPDPSLFIMDAANQSIYYLSQRRMNLQREYRSVLEGDYVFPDREMSAFAITPNRRALAAFGNQIYYAPLP